MKKTPLKRFARLKRDTRLRAMSPKRKRDSVRYGTLRRGFLTEHPTCQVDHCRKPSVDVHHIHGRAGSNFLDVTTWLAACRWHHDQIHSSPNTARQKGLLA